MSVVTLLAHARRLGVKIWADGDRLQYDAPPGVMTPELRDELVVRKAEILDLLRVAATSSRRNAPPITPVPRGGDLAVSSAQRRLWFVDRLGASAAYNVGRAVRLRGPLDEAALQRSLDGVVRRHEILRTTFPAIEGQPVQRIASPATVPLVSMDLSHLAPADRERAAQRHVDDGQGEPFDLARGPLLRCSLIRLAEDDHVLLLAMHHIIIDGWSIDVLMHELAAHYEAYIAGTTPSLPELPVQYADYAQWQNAWLQGDVVEELLEFWWGQLGPEPPVLALATDRPRRPVMTYEGATHRFVLPPAVAAPLEELSRRQGVSVAMTLLAAFQTLLMRYTGQDDVIVGSPIANRNRSEIESLIGFFVNNLVLRTDLSGDPTFTTLLHRVRRVSLAAYDHQDLPFEQLVKELVQDRDMSRNPLFQVVFAMQNASTGRFELPGLQVEPFARRLKTTHFDLELHMSERSDEFAGTFVYNTDLFDLATIERMAGHYQTLLRSIVAAPESRISKLSMLDDAERRALLAGWDETPEVAAPAQCLHELFEAQVARTPEATAVTFEERRLTYGELNARANQVAHRLRSQGAGPDVLVGLCAERCFDMVVGLLGILKAGAAYVPLDPAYPVSRMEFMIEDARMPILLASPHLVASLPVDHATVVPLEPATFADEPTTDLPRAATPSNLAYVIYTSGSTGHPKGVLVEHRNVTRLFASTARWFEFDATDVWTLFHSYAFDFSVWEIWGALLHGGRLVVVPYEVSRSPAEFLALVRREQVTVLNQTPSAFRQFIAADARSADGEASSLRLVIFGGEALELQSLRPWMDRHGDERPRLINMYGITETTVHVTYRPITLRDLDEAPGSVIGQPIPDLRVCILDERGQPVPVGVPGELYVGGAGVTRGYLERPELTAQRFVPDPFAAAKTRLYRTGDVGRRLANGDIVFLGRNDEQVKIRGFRIELGEIESAFTQHARVREAVVVVQNPKGTADAKRLVAYVVADEPDDEALPAELRTFVSDRLPRYMVPAAIVPLDALPLTSHGKLDRRALPAPSTQRQVDADYVAPRGEVENEIAAIWCGVLGVDRVGRDDSFFELGGESLLLAQVHARLVDRLDRDLSLVDLFQYPTVASLAGLLCDDDSAGRTYIQTARARLAERAGEEDRGDQRAVAIIGMAGRFPGAANVEQFWDNLCDGVESIARFDESELRAAGVDAGTLRDSAFVPAKGFLDEADCFDAGFFGYSPREAEVIDPQHRLILECAWTALEAAGHDPEEAAARIGVYVGSSANSYVRGLRANGAIMSSIDPLTLKYGNEADFVATRIAYKLNLRGPAVNVQTACSTSLVAVHEACKSLLAGECTIALAGGVRVTAPLKAGYVHQEGGILSRDGHCRTFDADASGTVGGDGVGIVVLKRLADAVADGDRIHAVILGSAINNDGATKVGYTAPSVEGQAEAVAGALCAADVDPASIGYVEAHGTATELGDPIEVSVLAQVFSETTDRRQYCALGALKTNVGHMDTAAGVGGLIKTALAVEHGKIPPSLHYCTPNPQIDFDHSPFFVNTVLRDWETHDHPRRAGVNSLGMGGTNVHVVLEEPPAVTPSATARPWQLLTLSARTPSALERATDDLLGHLERHPDINLADAAFTLQVGRKDFEHRRMLVAEDGADATRVLRARDPLRLVDATHEGGVRPVVFMFPGQGAQHPGMGRDLYATQPVFRAEVDRCCAALEATLGFDLRSVLFPDAADTEDAAQRLERTALAQPALFTIEYALARQWMAWGIEPVACIGHSIGEYVAACMAGVMSPEDAATLVAERGRLMDTMPAGSMLAVPLSPDHLEPSLPHDLAIATINGPELCVVSGAEADVTAFDQALRQRGVEPQRLHTSHAFHSSMMDPIVEPFRALVERVALRAPQRPYVSNVTGTWITAAEATDPAYYATHLRNTVRFSEGLETLFEDSSRVLLEVGPGRTLGSLARRHPERPAAQTVVSSLRHPKEDRADEATMAEALGRVWLSGARPRWSDVHAGERRCRIGLPTYPFERRRYWVDGQRDTDTAKTAHRKAAAKDWMYAPSWHRTTAPGGHAAPDGVRVLLFADRALGGDVAESLRRRGCAVTCVRIGERFEHTNDDHFVIDPTDVEHYERLLADLDAGVGRPERIAHMWSLAAPDDASAEGTLDLGLYSIVRLMGAMEAGGADATGELTIVTNHADEVIGTESLRPLQAASLGPAKVVPLEFPAVRCRTVDVDDAESSADRDRRAEDLADELLTPANDAVVAYRGRHRWVQRFAPVPDPAATSPRVREQGVYLITGGLGGVGLVTGAWLAKTYRARLVLLGRSPLPARETWDRWLAEHGEDDAMSIRIGHVRALESSGAEVMTCCADATDEAAMRDAVAEAESRFGPLNGVFHAAGETDVRTPMRSFDRAEFERVFQAKRRGVLTLEQVLEGRPLDFCVVHSSLASVMGALELGAYTAAHLYMDAFVWARRRTSALPWMTVNWDAWRTWRNASKPVPPGLAEYIMNSDDAAEALERVFAQGDTPQLLVSTGDLETRIAQWGGSRRAADDASDAPAVELHPRASSLRSEYEAPRDETECALVGIWERLLGIESVGIYDNFFELGGDSVLNLQIVAKAKQAGLRITPKSVFEHQTIAALAAVATDVDTSAETTATEGDGTDGRDIAGSTSNDARPATYSAPSLSPDDLAAITRQLGRGGNAG